MADLYALVHAEAGPLRTFLTAEEAEEGRMAMLRDEPACMPDLWVEPFVLLVAVADERSRPRGDDETKTGWQHARRAKLLY